MTVQRFSGINTSNGKAEGHHKVTYSLTDTERSVDCHLRLCVNHQQIINRADALLVTYEIACSVIGRRGSVDSLWSVVCGPV
jgi:hypothetical protein